ncbi:hypothetical protein [Bacillus sp. FJAT-49736]|uniref:hypothetical protein n=1 Tax=Bacillus sp. FJAT-49736 TaxID=2833582 RepID=UPI001BC9B5BD|nr:hypothetical protein [Bacillus sp. FJAT-49736]MBS4173470.1 hypothetical protein [Bacillus sp. FJAT-49736]
MPLKQMDKFTFNHSDQQDALYSVYTANQIKSLFDSRGEELRIALNLLITALLSTEGASNIGTSSIQDVDGVNVQEMLKSVRDKLKSKADGSSGADYVNATAIQGLAGETVQAILKSLKGYTDTTKQSLQDSINQTNTTLDNKITTTLGNIKASTVSADPIAIGSGATVQEQLAWLLSQIAIAATGSIPDGSLTEAKLAQAVVDKINKSLSNIGVMTTLQTIDKSSLVNALNEHMAEEAIHDVSGTANAITVNIGNYTYAQFKQLHFKAAVDNTGNVTINVDNLGEVPALKFDGSQLPAGAIKAGKIYDWYYDTSNGGCFFLIAKASGNAGAGDVLAGKTASSDNGEFIGTMPNKGAITFTPGTANQIIPAGYHNGLGIVKGDSKLIANNIKSGVTIFGVLGTYGSVQPGDTLVHSNPTVKTTNQMNSYAKVKETAITKGGKFRVKFDAAQTTSASTSYARVYVNGVPIGIERELNGSSYVTFTEDIDVPDNGLIQVYGKNTAGVGVNVRNLNLYIDGGTFAINA